MDLSVFQTLPVGNEFRSDTFTTPTADMVAALATTTLGDSVYNEDVTTLNLEKKVAQMAGKEAGLFCVSGTLLNQIALRTNLHQPPHAVLCDHRSHIYVDEAGGVPTLSQAMIQSVVPRNGVHLTLEDIVARFVPDDGEIHGCPTKVISLENTLHGMVFPLAEIKRIAAFCKHNRVKLHLDGARLWNALVALGVLVAEYCSYFDSVSLCLSKSLGAPVGSVLVSTKEFVKKANHFRKQCGGGIRQAGLLALMATVAIDTNMAKLARTHEMARDLQAFCEDHGIVLALPVHTNFVFIDLAANKINTDFFTEACKRHDVRAFGSRILFHYQVSDEAFAQLKQALAETFEEAKKNPYDESVSVKYYNVYDAE